jgi:hypothetical protein
MQNVQTRGQRPFRAHNFRSALLPCVILDRGPKGLRQPYCHVISEYRLDMGLRGRSNSLEQKLYAKLADSSRQGVRHEAES